VSARKSGTTSSDFLLSPELAES